MYRSHGNGGLRLSNAGEQVILSGWVQKIRDKGFMVWIDLRDRYGLTQLIHPFGGLMLTIKGLTVAVLGGLGSFYGALLAGFILGLAESYGVLFISAQYKDVISFIVLLIILIARPGGLSRKEFFVPK